MDKTLPDSDFSYDPVTAINEEDAKGKTAEIFSDIRKTMNIPLVTSIWRGLASMNNSLEEVWELTKPIYLSGTPELALNKMISTIELPLPTIIDRIQLPTLKPIDFKNIQAIINVYNKSNGMNLMALSALIKSDFIPRVNIVNTLPPLVQNSFPRLMTKNEIKHSTWEIVKKINSIGSPNGIDSHVATLWRHLAYWPEFLSLIYNNFESLNNDGKLDKTLEDVLNYVKINGINLKRHKKKYTNLNTIALNTINDYVSKPNQVIRMVVLGHIVSKCLRESPSN